MNLPSYLIEGQDYSREVWVHQNPNAERLAIFLDAEYYLKRMNVVPILEQLPLSAVFVSHIDGAHRHADFTCQTTYAGFIAYDVLGWAASHLGLERPEGHLIAGLSLSGLAAAHIWLTYPNIFPLALCQSGSFWWNEEWLTSEIGSIDAERKIWLSVGDKELDKGISHPPSGLRQEETQVAACTNFFNTCDRAGAQAEFQVFSGGHDLACWRAELPDALEWLLT